VVEDYLALLGEHSVLPEEHLLVQRLTGERGFEKSAGIVVIERV
jgi:hypothetical protein